MTCRRRNRRSNRRGSSGGQRAAHCLSGRGRTGRGTWDALGIDVALFTNIACTARSIASIVATSPVAAFRDAGGKVLANHADVDLDEAEFLCLSAH